jgi:hypothetical protein
VGFDDGISVTVFIVVVEQSGLVNGPVVQRVHLVRLPFCFHRAHDEQSDKDLVAHPGPAQDVEPGELDRLVQTLKTPANWLKSC